MKGITSYIWLLLACLMLLGCHTVSEDKSSMALSSIERTPRLYVVQYNVHKILTYEDVSTLEVLDGNPLWGKLSIPILGDRKIALPVDATIRGYIEFDGTSVEEVDGKVVVTLAMPQLEMTSSVVDYDREKQFLSWNRFSFSEEEKETILRTGKRKILQEMKWSDVMDRSRKSAFNALLPILEGCGYAPENVVVRFVDEDRSDALGESVLDMLRDRL